MIETLITLIVASSIFAVGALVGDYIIPAIIKSIKGNPRPKQRYDYAEKEWIKTLTSYSH